MQINESFNSHALIIDQHTTYSIEVCRSLTKQGYLVDIFAEPYSPSLHSRFCHNRLLAPPLNNETSFLSSLQSIVQKKEYQVIFLCSEEYIPLILKVIKTSDRWRALPLSDPSNIKILLNKKAVLQRVAEAGVPIPTTKKPKREEDVLIMGQSLGFPLIIKGEKGEGSQAVRVVQGPKELITEYKNVLLSEESTEAYPVLQEFVSGIKYTVGGLFHKGIPLRVIAYRSKLIYPPKAGATIKGITENPPGLLETAFKAFDSLKYTGLGNVEFIFDMREKKYKFLEINPRVWGNIGFAQHAGVDFYTPYRSLVDGNIVKPDLRFQTGVIYRRWLQDLRLILKQPGRLFGFVFDCLNPQVKSDFDWSDLSPTFCFPYIYKRLFTNRPSSIA